MNNVDLKKILCSNSDIVLNLLESLNAHHINITENIRIQFGLQDNTSGRSHCIYLDEKMLHMDYPNAITEDIIQMVARLRDTDYTTAINYIGLFISGDIQINNDNNTIVKDVPLIDYDYNMLDLYPEIISELFIKDGIPVSVQRKFGIRFSEKYNRVLVPIIQNNKLVGIMGRYNQKKIDDFDIPKWFPILPYQRSKVLFPFDINKDYIIKTKTCFLVESEKTPMLCSKYNWNNILALGGNSVKTPQIELLKTLEVQNIILALDKGLGNGYIEYSASRLKEYGFNVFYIDVDNIDYLPDKECVFDLNDVILIEQTIKKFIRRV